MATAFYLLQNMATLTSVTRISNIVPTMMTICQLHFSNWFKILPNTKYTGKKLPNTARFDFSEEILPNLVTLKCRVPTAPYPISNFSLTRGNH